MEGVTHAGGSNFFAADFFNGEIYLLDVNSGLLTTVVRPLPNTTAIGLSSTSNLLFAAGAGFAELPNQLILGSGPEQPEPTLHVYSITTGTPVARCVVDGGIINDVDASGGTFAYYSDSEQSALFELDIRRLPECIVRKIKLEKLFIKGRTNLNGVAKFRGGVIVAHTTLAALFFVDVENGDTVQRLMENGSVVGADGLELRGNLLYVAQNSENKVSTWRVSMGKGRKVEVTFVKDIMSGGFNFPTTVAVGGGRLVVPSPRFPDFPVVDNLTISALRLSDLRM